MKKLILILAAFSLLTLPAFAQEDELELPETFTSDDGLLTVSYPEGWTPAALQGFDGYYIFTSNADLAAAFEESGETGDPASGDVVVGFLLPPVVSLLGLPEDGSITEAAQAVAESGLEEGDVVGEVEELEIGGFAVARLPIQSENTDNVLYVVDTEALRFAVIIVTAPGETEEAEVVAQAMLETVELGEFDASTYTDDASGLTIDLPEGWQALSFAEGLVALANDMEALTSSTLLEGQINVGVFAPSALESFYGIAPEADIEALYEEVLPIFVFEGETGEIEEITVGETPAYSVSYTSEEREGEIIVLETEQGFVLVNANAFPGEYADFEAELLSILESIRFEEAAE